MKLKKYAPMHIFTPDEINTLEWTKKKFEEIERIYS